MAAVWMTALMIPVVFFAVHLPSVNMTAPKELLGYGLFMPLSILYLVVLSRGCRITGEINRANTAVRRWTVGLLSLFIMMMAAWGVATVAGHGLSGGIMIRREILRIIPGVIIALFWWHTGVTLRFQRIVHGVFAVSAVPLALGGIAQILGLDPVGWAYSFREGVFSLMGHPNMLAPCLVMGMACQWGLGREAQSRAFRIVWWSLLPVTGVCLIITFSKGAWAGALIAWIISVTLLGEPRFRRRVWMVTAVGLLVT
ncbi:MAG TPA: hypothetical protein PLV45_03200, partial [bacterium]|nr:hypothetical protein [bacterium]